MLSFEKAKLTETLNRQPISVKENEVMRLRTLLRLVGENEGRYEFFKRGQVFTFQSVKVAA